jgi:hypothetical protein
VRPFDVYWEAVGRNWLVCLLDDVAKLAGRTWEKRERMVLRRGGRLAMMMPTHTSLIEQMDRSMASHIISCERRNLIVTKILAMERAVPLVCVSEV